MKAYIIIILFIISLCLSCEDSTEESDYMSNPVKVLPKGFTKKKVDNRYTIYIPDYLEETTVLSKDASFQAMNVAKEIYTVVIDEPIDDFVEYYWDSGIYDHAKTELENYRTSQLAYFIESGTLIEEGEIRERVFGKNIGEITYIASTIDGVDIYYAIGFVQGEDKFYYIFAWTLLKQHEALREDLFNIVKSFRELNYTEKN